MNVKKNSRFDLERKRFVLLQIGLLTAGSLTLAAFTYTETVRTEHEKQRIVSDLIDIDAYQMVPKVEPKIQQQHKQQNDDQQFSQTSDKISSDIKKKANTSKKVTSRIVGELGIPTGPGDLGLMIDIPGDNAVDSFPTYPTEYIGGRVAMTNFINETVVYPQVDREIGNQGRVYLSFIIEKDGSVSNVKVIRGVSPTIDREAKRIVRKFPKWKPAENAWGKVRTRVQMPINFTFSKD